MHNGTVPEIGTVGVVGGLDGSGGVESKVFSGIG